MGDKNYFVTDFTETEDRRSRPRRISKMTLRRKRFINEYLRDLNQTAAAIRAGYAKKTAGETASELMKNPDIQVQIQDSFIRRSKRTELKQDDVIREIAAVAFADMGTFVSWDNNGLKLKDSLTLNKGESSVISEVIHTVSERSSSTRVKLHSKLEALNMLARHLGMFVEKVEHTGKIDINTDVYQNMSLKEAQEMLKAFRARPALEGKGLVQ